MAGHRPWKELREKVAARVGEDALKAKVAEQRHEYEEEQARLAELRKARAMTQAQLAKVLGTSQAEVSRIERRADVFVSTLKSYVEAMGGELDLVATFADGRRVVIELADLQTDEEVAGGRRGEIKWQTAEEFAAQEAIPYDVVIGWIAEDDLEPVGDLYMRRTLVQTARRHVRMVDMTEGVLRTLVDPRPGDMVMLSDSSLGGTIKPGSSGGKGRVRRPPGGS